MTSISDRTAQALYKHKQSVGDSPDGLTPWDHLPEDWADEYREAAKDLEYRNLLMPDLPEIDKSLGVWDGEVADAITHVTDGKVCLEWGGHSSGGLLELSRDEAHEIALLLLAASQWKEPANDQH